MTKTEMRTRVAELLEEKARLASFNLALPPNLLMELKRLLYRLGETRVQLSRPVKYAFEDVEFADNPSLEKVQFLLDHHIAMQKAHNDIADDLFDRGNDAEGELSVRLADMHGDKHNELWKTYLPLYKDRLQSFKVVPTPQHIARAKREFLTVAKKLPRKKTYRRESIIVRLARKVGVKKYAADPQSLLARSRDLISRSAQDRPSMANRYLHLHDSEPDYGHLADVHQWLGTVHSSVPEELGAEHRNRSLALSHEHGQLATAFRGLVGNQGGNHETGLDVTQPNKRLLTRLARKLGVYRYAKVDNRHPDHPLVAGFPISTFLRHLSNDPNNHPAIRELAKIAVTGGHNKSGDNVPVALWMLHDAMHEHNHPMKGHYNLMSAADKVGLDAHVHRALQMISAVERTPADEADDWVHMPEHIAVLAGRSILQDANASPSGIRHHQRIHQIVNQSSPNSSREDIDESIRRHAHRGDRAWRRSVGLEGDNSGILGGTRPTDIEKVNKYNNSVFPYIHEQDKATRYSRLRSLLRRFNSPKLGRLKYAMGDGPGNFIGTEKEIPALLRRLKRTVKYAKKRSVMQGWIAPDGTFHPIGLKEMHIHVATKIAGPSARQEGLDPRKVVEDAGYMHVGNYQDQNGMVTLHGYHPRREFSPEQIEALKKLGSDNGADEVTLDGGGKSTPVRMKRTVKKYRMVQTNFIDALRRVRSSDQQALQVSAKTIAAKLGLAPVSLVGALHDSTTSGATPGTAMAVYGHASPETIHSAAAWLALNANQPGVAVFHPRPMGRDGLYKFRMHGSGMELRNRLDRAGLSSRVLIPHSQGFDVMIPDPGKQLFGRVKSFTDQQKVPLEASSGFLHTIGDAEKSDARSKFRGIIEKQEHAQPMSRLRKLARRFGCL